MAGTAIFSGTCDPSTISPLESQIFKLGGTAHGEERHTLAKLRTLYLQVAESVNAVTKEVGSMQFAWASRLEGLQSRHTEADRMHIHMKIDLEQEENRYKQARSDAESMRASLPPDGVVLEGAQWSNYLIYRRKNMKIREGDAEKSAERLESLKEQLRQQGEQVDQLDRDIMPVISVCSHLTRAADVFQDITAKVLQEGEHILS
ncbi:hypothetical protein FRC15_009532 [Serendipita sp. 397]|nr:hypothetical protein FRC15_009532 [Serendipita sp. 397]